MSKHIVVDQFVFAQFTTLLYGPLIFMSKSWMSKNWSFVVIFVFVFLGLASCKKNTDTAGGTPAAAPFTSPGVVDNSNGMYVRLEDGVSYSYAVHESSSFTTSCTVTTSSTNKDILCYVEGKELDLFYNGASLVFNFPSNMCSYVNWYPYFYYDLQPGVGPTSVSYDIDANNNKVNVVIAPVGTASLVGSDIVCTYDYTKSGNPNCCEGNYNLTTRTWNATTSSYSAAVTVASKWEGNGHDCLAGPGVVSQPKSKDRFPLAQIYYVEGQGLNFRYKIDSPISTATQKQVYVANYYNLADNAGAKPAALTSPNTTYFGTPQDTFEVQCLDRAYEEQARIRVMIREWNLTSEYNLGATGNPDTTGNESAPWGAFPNNDFFDWKDWLNVYPGR